jgi:hypothetical protein
MATFPRMVTILRALYPIQGLIHNLSQKILQEKYFILNFNVLQEKDVFGSHFLLWMLISIQ